MAVTGTVDPYNEINYWKNIAEQAKASGNTAGIDYASKQAQQYYDMLSNDAERAKVSSLNSAGLQEYRQNMPSSNTGGTSQPTDYNTNSDGVMNTGTLGVDNLPGAGASNGLSPELQALFGQLMNQQSTYGDQYQQFQQQYQQQYQQQQQLLQQLMQSQQQLYQQSQQPDTTDTLIQQLMEIMNGQAIKEDELRKQAEEDAKAQADEQRASYQRLIDSLVSGQDAALGQVNANLANARQDLQDTQFQDYLAARQGVANRGLANSGIADQVNTQLMLANGRNLANLSRQAQADTTGIRSDYGARLAEANAQLSGINQNKLADDIYSQLYGQAQDRLDTRANQFLDLIGKTIGYDKISASDRANLQFQYDKLGTDQQQFYDKLNADQQLAYAQMDQADRQFYEKLNADQRLEYDKMDQQDRQFYQELSSKERIEYDKMSQSDQQFYARLDSDERQFYDKLKSDYGLQLTQIMGQDANGNPTLDYLKLAETIRSNQANEGLKSSELTAQIANWTANNQLESSRIQLGYDQLAQQTAKDSATMQQAINNAQTDVDKMVLSGLKTQLDAVGERLKQKSATLPEGQTLPDNDQDVVTYNNILNSISRLINPNASASAERPAAGAITYSDNRRVTGTYANEINQVSKANNIDPGLYKALLQQESSLGAGISNGNVAQVNGMENATPQQSIAKGAEMFGSYLKKYGSVEKALAAYNMGPGVITYMEKNNISSVREAMQRFSDYQKSTKGYKVYGDPQYIDHVLRYWK